MYMKEIIREKKEEEEVVLVKEERFRVGLIEIKKKKLVTNKKLYRHIIRGMK